VVQKDRLDYQYIFVIQITYVLCISMVLTSTLTKISIDDIPSYLPFSFFVLGLSLQIFVCFSEVKGEDGSALMYCLFAFCRANFL
jgi:hypothetical protein